MPAREVKEINPVFIENEVENAALYLRKGMSRLTPLSASTKLKIRNLNLRINETIINRRYY